MLRRLREDARRLAALEKRFPHLDELLDDLTQRTRETDAESDRREVDRSGERPHRLLDLVDRVVEGLRRPLELREETARLTRGIPGLLSRFRDLAELLFAFRGPSDLDVYSDFTVRDHVTSARSTA